MPSQRAVTLAQVQASNAGIDGDTYPRTAVFVGGTSGIGEAVLHELSLAGKSKWPARIYVVGREESADRVNESLDLLRAQCPGVDLIWTPGDVSLLSEVTRICAEFKDKEKSLDLLFLSAGYCALGGREDTKEGLPVSHSLGYYSRILFIQHLLPLLKASTRGRVVAVLGAGMETANIDLDDLNLDKPGSFTGFGIQNHTVTMLTMTLEQLAEENRDVTFIHAYPGLVNTGNLQRGWRGRWILQILMNIVVAPFFLFWAFTIEESRQRMLYIATSAKYGGRGVPQDDGVLPGLTTRGEETGGLFMVGHMCATMADEKLLTTLRRDAKERIWAKTVEVLGPYPPA
ncbi:hypothetical protein GE09DRAFT_194160 [Coniochaeta sp. 2T2.1]|nr:hypothetical protein GE09DRAFT_194160 [Coniochaeta sp. 2T2.1]